MWNRMHRITNVHSTNWGNVSSSRTRKLETNLLDINRARNNFAATKREQISRRAAAMSTRTKKTLSWCMPSQTARRSNLMGSGDGRITRRSVLRAAAAASGALAANVVSGDDKPAPRIGLGFSLYGMKALTLEAALEALATIGYDCVELPVMNEWPAD